MEFEYSHEFRNRSVEEVRGKIVSWLNAEGAKEIEEDGAGGIEAVHGTMMTLMASDRNSTKKLQFFLTPQGRGTTVKATVVPTLNTVGGVHHTMKETRINGGLLLEECWASVEGIEVIKTREMIEAETNFLEETRPKGSKETDNFLIKLGFVDAVVWTVLVLLMVYVVEVDVPIVLLGLPFIGSAGLIMLGLMRTRMHRSGSSL